VGWDELVQNPGVNTDRLCDYALMIITSLGKRAYILMDDKATGKNTPEMFCQRRFA